MLRIGKVGEVGMIHPERRRENLKKIEEMDREKVLKGLECHRVDGMNRINCSDCPYYESNDARRCFNYLHNDAIALLNEQEELLRKLQKDKDKLCLDVSEWKHKFHDRSLKEQDAVKPHKGKNPEESSYDCGNCGYPLWEDELYCAHCGKAVDWEGR